MKKSTNRRSFIPGHKKLNRLLKRNEKYVLVFYKLIPLFVPIVYLAANWRTNGPVVLSDELGYLTKATTFAGDVVDNASSWHGGFSILIAPIFYFIDDPYLIWKVLLIVQALVWGGFFYVLQKLLTLTFKKRTVHEVNIAVLISALYPAAVLMSGYAFPTTVFSFLFILSIYTLVRSKLQPNRMLLAHVLLSGYLSWVHPIGYAVVVSTVCFLFVGALLHKSYIKYTTLALTIIGTTLFYRKIVHSWFSDIMTPDGFKIADHYSVGLEQVKVIGSKYWKVRIFGVPGRISYFLVASLGFVGYVFDDLFTKTLKALRKPKHKILSLAHLVEDNLAACYLVLATIGVFMLTILPFLFNDKSYVSGHNYWIYGRYYDMIIIPLFAFGILSTWRLRTSLVSAFFVVATGILLYYHVDASNTALGTFRINSVHGFWPYIFGRDIHYIKWFIAGAVPIVVIGLIRNNRYRFVLSLLLAMAIYLPATSTQLVRHYGAYSGFRRDVSGLYDFIDSNYEFDDCIGISDIKTAHSKDLQQYTAGNIERLRMHVYYLHNYEPRRMNIQEWLDSCDGPYLSYDYDLLANYPGVSVIGHELFNDLYVAVKDEQVDTLIRNVDQDQLRNFYISDEENECFQAGCYIMIARDLARYTQVGEFVDGGVADTRTFGLLFNGPNFSLDKGDYTLALYGDLSGRVTGSRVLFSGAVDGGRSQLIDDEELVNDVNTYDFSVPQDVEDFQVKLKVRQNTDIVITGYSVTLRSVPEQPYQANIGVR